MDGWMDGGKEGWMDGLMDGWMEGGREGGMNVTGPSTLFRGVTSKNWCVGCVDFVLVVAVFVVVVVLFSIPFPLPQLLTDSIASSSRGAKDHETDASAGRHWVFLHFTLRTHHLLQSVHRFLG